MTAVLQWPGLNRTLNLRGLEVASTSPLPVAGDVDHTHEYRQLRPLNMEYARGSCHRSRQSIYRCRMKGNGML